MFKVHWAIVALIAVSACENGSSSGFGGSASRLPGEPDGANAEYSYAVTRGLARAGERAQKFEVRAGDCRYDQTWSGCGSDYERSEYHARKRWGYGTDQWMGYSIYLPGDFATSNRVATSVGEIGTPSGFPPLMHLEMQGNSYYMRVFQADKDLRIANVSNMRGRWTDVVVHFDTSDGKQLLEVFVNGSQKARIENWLSVRSTDYDFRYGVFRIFVSRHGGPMTTQVLFVDEAKMGPSLQSVSVDEENPVD